MQSQPETAPQRRFSSAHSRYPTSSSSIGAPDSSHTIDSQQQHHNEGQAPLQRRPSQRQEPAQSLASTAASQLTKLDGVLYHFYTTTANLVLQSRIAHLRSSLHAAPLDGASSDQRPTSATGTSSQIKLSRWFGLQIPDSDLFKEELRFWRSVTTMLGIDAQNSHQMQSRPDPAPASVPDLVVDVLLDLSNVSNRHEILLLIQPSHTNLHGQSQPVSLRTAHASARRVCIDGRQPGEAPSAQSSPRPQRIVLERWRLRFDSTPPSEAPDLSTFYKQSVVHFRALSTLLDALPSNLLAAKLEALKAGPVPRSSVSQPSYPSLFARDDMGSQDAEMTLGCRLSMTFAPEDLEGVAPEEVDIKEALAPEKGLELTHADDVGDEVVGKISSHGHYAVRTLAPIPTPIGHLELSVTYRKLTGFSIEDSESLRTANDIQVDLDEDYFKSPQGLGPTPSQSTKRPDVPSSSPQAADSGSSPIGGEQSRHQPPAAAPFPVAAPSRIGGISAMRPVTLAAQRSSPESVSGGEVAGSSQSSTNASVFSTSAPGRHSAGLSSLRRTGSNKSNLSVTGPANQAGGSSSPALAAALSAEPAFVVPSSVRRPSTGERRLRTLSGLSSGRPSPPVSPASATFDLPEAGSSLPRSTSAAFSTSATGRSISTRTTSGFAGTTTGTTGSMGPPSSHPRPSVSFSPSSPSPLAQQMSLQGSRFGGGPGLVPQVSQSASSFRSVSGSGMRTSMSGTGVLTTPSLRSVFQSYAPRSQNVSIASMSRTPPTVASTFAHGSYSPSNLGTGLRSSSIRRNSSTSDAGSGSAFGASVTSSSAAAAAAAKPQMIKRYSTNFSYRQNRERAGIYGSSLGSEASSSLGAGGEPSSYPRFGGTGGSLSSAYGRSWISRLEQRQGLGTGGAFARTSSLDDATAAATASAASRYRPFSASGAPLAGGLTPSPRSHDEDMDDLVRLLETRPAFGTSSMGKLTSLRNERRNAPGLSSTPKEGAAARPGPGFDTLTDSVQSNLGQDRPSSLSGSGLRSGGGIRTANPMSRSQLDDLLSRMAESVGILGSKEQGSSASGETSSDVAASNETRNHGAPSNSPGPMSAPSVREISQPLSHAQIAATLGKGRGSTGKEPEGAADFPTSRLSSPGTLARALPGETGARSRSAVNNHVRGYGTAATRTPSSLLPAAPPACGSRNHADPSSTFSAPQSSSTASLDATRVPEYDAEGDLMFKVDGQQEYDPEDELPGEMEMMPEEGVENATRSGVESGAAVFSGGVEGGMGATLPVGAHREGRAHEWHVAERWERERAQEAERRRADAEMSRNFGQEVGASTRGRGSHSPWRATTHSSPQTATTLGGGVGAAAAPQSLAGTGANAGAVGFRSSSTRPLTGTNRLVGVGVGSTGLSLASADGRRGYGVSAPSTQFHYQPSPRPPAAQSYPVSRDEVYQQNDNDDDDAEEDADD